MENLHREINSNEKMGLFIGLSIFYSLFFILPFIVSDNLRFFSGPFLFSLSFYCGLLYWHKKRIYSTQQKTGIIGLIFVLILLCLLSLLPLWAIYYSIEGLFVGEATRGLTSSHPNQKAPLVIGLAGLAIFAFFIRSVLLKIKTEISNKKL